MAVGVARQPQNLPAVEHVALGDELRIAHEADRRGERVTRDDQLVGDLARDAVGEEPLADALGPVRRAPDAHDVAGPVCAEIRELRRRHRYLADQVLAQLRHAAVHTPHAGTGDRNPTELSIDGIKQDETQGVAADGVEGDLICGPNAIGRP